MTGRATGSRKLTIADIKRAAEKQGGIVDPDGLGGYDVLANADATRRWIESGTWTLVLPLNEYEPEERQALLRDCLDTIKMGTEPFND